MLVPGLLADGALWAAQLRDLAGVAELSVADPAAADTVPGLATALLAAAPPRFALAGLSLGGYIALEVMRQAPERVDRLALLDTSAQPDTPAATEGRRALVAIAADGRFDEIPATVYPGLVHASRHEDGELWQTYRAMALRTGPESFARQQEAIIARPDSRPSLGAIACPTLVLCGREDALTPLALHEELAAGIEGAELVVVERCGHLSSMERPDEVTRALRRWLEN